MSTASKPVTAAFALVTGGADINARSSAVRRRELLKAAAAVVLGVEYASKAAAQSKPKMQKERTMASLDVTATISIEHVTIPSQKSFESVKAALERLVPRMDDGVFVLLRYGEAERARRELEQAPTLSIFGFRDHGALLKIHGLQQKAIQYDIGNPLTASRMTEHQLSAALYAPIRVLLRESPHEGVVAFEYDRPASVFGQFNNADVNKVAEQLDLHLQAVLQKAAE
jgi:Domain of unknown function DUF302